jgi:glutamate--cysteine ligase catalytic subunit
MGLLSAGTPLPWFEAKKYADHVRNHGITQFLHTWDRLKDRQGDKLLWGDEVRPGSSPIHQCETAHCALDMKG